MEALIEPALARAVRVVCATAALALTGVGSLFLGLGAAGAPVASAATRAVTGCHARASKPLAMVPFLEAKASSGHVPLVRVCIDGRGPYSFVLSTGAGATVISPALARSLHLRRSGAPVTVRGVTCLTAAKAVKVRSWSMGGVRLAPQKVLVAPIGAQGVKRPLRGVLGSDVLSRFGAVRIDAHSEKLTLLGREGGPPKGNVYILGDSATKPPRSLLTGAPKVGTVVRVLENPQGTIVAVAATISGHSQQLAIDSGSAGSALVPRVTSSLKLTPSSATSGISGVGCKASAPDYTSGPWDVGGSSLPDAPLVSRPIAGTVNAGLQGILGFDVLTLYGSAVVDYTAAHLWLSAG